MTVFTITDRPDELSEGDGWVVVGRAADVPLLEGRAAALGARRIAVFRLPGGWAAIDHACPHRQGPLADGLVSGGCVTCPLHARRYSLTTGARIDGEGPGVRSYEVRERDGLLEVRAQGA